FFFVCSFFFFFFFFFFPIPETLQCTEKWRQVAPVQRFSEGAGVFITDILHCAFGNPQDQLFYR
ncbi:hypothetical protein, partial [Salmonella enterica]|uniref:hypothetical protein n=1 Tax=Salmonella enterica TaxID=28901 RepID=UPI0020CAFCE0